MNGEELYNKYVEYFAELELNAESWYDLTDEDKVVWDKLAEFAWSYRDQ